METWVNGLSVGGKITTYLATGLAIGLPVSFFPKGPLRRIGQLPLLSPNWVSFWRLPITWIGFALYFGSHPFLGYCLVVFGYSLDRVDGRIASVTADLRSPEEKERGRWFDPLVDKLTTPPFILLFSWRGLLDSKVAWAIVAFEAVGTMIRPPFTLGDAPPVSQDTDKAWKRGVLRAQGFLTRYVRTSAASGVGKTKIMLQFAVLLFCLPMDQRWIEHGMSATCAAALAALFGGLSVGSRLRITPRVERSIDRLTRVFEH